MRDSVTALEPLAAVVLAGGASTRMGADKALMSIAGKPMIGRVIERLAPQLERIVLSANGDPARFAAFGLPVVADAIPGGLGPLAGLHAAMRWQEANLAPARFMVSVPADTPFFPDDLVQRLSAAQGGNGGTIAIAASSNGTHPVFALWPVNLVDDLERFLGGSESPKVLAFANRYRRVDVRFDDIRLENGETADPFFNVNTPDDATRAEAIAATLGL